MEIFNLVKKLNSFEEFNPMQQKAISAGLLEKSIVVSSPTASGKTLVAEIASLNSILNRKKKVVYTCPLRALASEHFNEFKKNYSKELSIKCTMSIGDFDSSGKHLQHNDVIFTTYEKLNSLLNHKTDWLSEIGLLVIDEIHSLGSDRGPALEMLITKLRFLNKHLQVLGLSATIPNARQLSDWLGAELVESNYRPIELKEGIYLDSEIDFGSSKIGVTDNSDAVSAIAIDTLGKGKQALVFVNTRKRSESTAKKLADLTSKKLSETEKAHLAKASEKILSVLEQPTLQCKTISSLVKDGVCFHNAGILQQQRTIIEDLFKGNYLKFICSTPTLCVVPETKLWHGVDDIQVNSFGFNKRLLALKGEKLVSIRPQEIQKIENTKDIIRLKTVSGFEIKVTENHNMYIKRKGKKLFLDASRCEVGDKIATISNLWGARSKKIKFGFLTVDSPFNDIEFDEDFSYFVGAMLGNGYSGVNIKDGNLLLKATPCLTGVDLENFKVAKKVCEKYKINFRERLNSYGIPAIYFSKSKWFRLLLANCGVIKGEHKFIANELKQMSKSNLVSLIQGLFDSDGWVQRKKIIGYSSISIQLIKDLQRLLLLFGVVSRIRERPPGSIKVKNNNYFTTKSYELTIAQKESIFKFQEKIGFRIKRKQEFLDELADSIFSNKHFIYCSACDYKLFQDVFEGRSKEHILWGKQKLEIINFLGKNKKAYSSELSDFLGFPPYKKERRLNHHFELIKRKKIGVKSEWRLNEIGEYVYRNVVVKKKSISNVLNLDQCPICRKKLDKKLKNGWRSKDFEGDIFWDYVNLIKTESKENHPYVFNVVLPSNGSNDHLFVAEGFLVHNSAGVNLPAFRVIIPSPYRYSGYGMVRIPVSEFKQMCLPYYVEIVTKEKGLMKIGEIVENDLKLNVLSFDLEKQAVEFKPIKNFFKRRAKGLVKLIFEDGNHLTLTKNHEVLVFKNNLPIWMPASKVNIEDLVLSAKNKSIVNKLPFFYEQFPIDGTFVLNCGNLFNKAKSLGFTEKELAKKVDISEKRIYCIKNNLRAMPLSVAFRLCDLLGYPKKQKASIFRLVKSRYGNPIKISVYPSKDFFWLVGFIASDGNLNRTIDKRTNSEYITLRVSNKNKKLIKKAENCFLSLNLTPYRNVRDDGSIDLEVGATLLAKLLVNYYGLKYNNKTTTVSVPDFLKNLSPEFIGAYLGGVFDGDGNFNRSKTKRGKNSNNYRILFSTGSKKFALGIQMLLRKMGIVSSFSVDKKVHKKILRNKEVLFSKPDYYVIFRKIEFIKTFSKFAQIYKTRINAEYSNYNNVNKRDNSQLDYSKLKIKKITQLKSEKNVYNIAVQKNENYFANNCLVHNCGRAGRPAYDDSGEAILIAKTEFEKDDYFDYFINGDVEIVESKLASDSQLRFHLLSSIATGFVFDLASAEKFFSGTFYASQTKDLTRLFVNITNIISELEEMKFVVSTNKRIDATPVGRRVAELYLDPESAFQLIASLNKKNFADFAYLFSIVSTSEFHPYLSVSKGKEAEMWEEIQKNKAMIPVDVEAEMFFDNELIYKYWTTQMLNEWISEIKEQALVDTYNIQPGIIRAKLSNADWLLYSCVELSKLLDLNDHVLPLNRMRKRVQYGIKEELVYLCELRGIGRVRARRLFNAGIKGISDLKKADVKDIEKIINSQRVAISIKQQLSAKK